MRPQCMAAMVQAVLLLKTKMKNLVYFVCIFFFFLFWWWDVKKCNSEMQVLWMDSLEHGSALTSGLVPSGPTESVSTSWFLERKWARQKLLLCFVFASFRREVPANLANRLLQRMLWNCCWRRSVSGSTAKWRVRRTSTRRCSFSIWRPCSSSSEKRRTIMQEMLRRKRQEEIAHWVCQNFILVC